MRDKFRSSMYMILSIDLQYAGSGLQCTLYYHQLPHQLVYYTSKILKNIGHNGKPYLTPFVSLLTMVCGVVVSMPVSHHADRGSNPGRGGVI